MTFWHSKCRVACAGDQVSAVDGPKRQVSCVSRPMRGSDGDPDIRYEGVAQMRGHLREQLGKPRRNG